ncbi:MAG: Wzz/FepE/Etk N-terminal domain-containing protein [Lachnospiraceae bacterium]|nr:Wzz/FepE/Etk N-terminal domain-containing protein [Lachnospiraceae bacterium]
MQIIKKTQNEIRINLIEIFKILLKKSYVIVVCGLAVGVAFYGVAKMTIEPQYTAKITLYVNNFSGNDGNTSITTGDLSASAKLVDTYSAIITSNSVMNKVVKQSGVKKSKEAIAPCITISSINNTEVFCILVQDTNPEQAVQIANAIADIAPKEIKEIVEGSSVKVIDRAEIPDRPSSPDYKKYMKIGLALGILISSIILFMLAMMDTNIKSEEDLSAWDIPILGVIPEFSEEIRLEQKANNSRKG